MPEKMVFVERLCDFFVSNVSTQVENMTYARE